MKDISESIKTVEDRDRLYSEIELLSEAIYKEGELKKALDSQISGTLRNHIADDESRETLSQRLLDLKRALDEFSVVKLTIAFEPTESTIDKLMDFVRNNIGGKTILALHVEPKLLGGAIFEFKGLYRDYTLKTKLEKVFEDKKEELYKI